VVQKPGVNPSVRSAAPQTAAWTMRAATAGPTCRSCFGSLTACGRPRETSSMDIVVGRRGEGGANGDGDEIEAWPQ
jgi:hypothetical protein